MWPISSVLKLYLKMNILSVLFFTDLKPWKTFISLRFHLIHVYNWNTHIRTDPHNIICRKRHLYKKELNFSLITYCGLEFALKTEKI